MQFKRILCVCTGNICRSPLAEAYLRRALPALETASAGVGALVGHGADEQAVRVANENGLDISGHAAQQLDAGLIGRYDLILVMENEQLQWIRREFPQASGRVFLASQWRDREDIADPFRRSDDYFDAVYQRLATSLDDWIEKIAPPHTVAGQGG